MWTWGWALFEWCNSNCAWHLNHAIVRTEEIDHIQSEKDKYGMKISIFSKRHREATKLYLEVETNGNLVETMGWNPLGYETILDQLPRNRSLAYRLLLGPMRGFPRARETKKTKTYFSRQSVSTKFRKIYCFRRLTSF